MPVTLTIDKAAGQLDPPFACARRPAASEICDRDPRRWRERDVHRRHQRARTRTADGQRVHDGVLLTLASWRVHLGSPRGGCDTRPWASTSPTSRPAALGPIFGATRGVGIRVQVINTASASAGRGHSHLGLHQESWPTRPGRVAARIPVRGVEVFILATRSGPAGHRRSQLTGGPILGRGRVLNGGDDRRPLWITTRTSHQVSNGRRHCRPTRSRQPASPARHPPQTFAVTATPAALSTGAPVKLWRPADWR